MFFMKPRRDLHTGASHHELVSHHRGLTGCPERARARAEIHESGAKNEGGQTCQLVSPGSPDICILCGVRLGRGAVRSVAAKLSRWRDPRANWTVRRSPLSSEPSVWGVRIGVRGELWGGGCRVDCFDVITYGKLEES